MKILIVHNRYRHPGGEDRAVQAESALLAGRGHEVERWEENNDSIIGPFAAGRTALRSVYSFQSAQEMKDRIQRFRPDLVHIHNFFPRLSPAIHIACRRASVPVVQTLHNFRLLCPAATFHFEGSLCEGCLGTAIPWRAVVRSCYRESRLASLAAAHMVAAHHAFGTWDRSVSQFIALSQFAREKFIAGGISPDKITVKPNFVDPDPGMGGGNGDFALFVGRLAEEKGVRTLLTAWGCSRNGPKLKIVGDGPLASDVAQAAATNPGIEWLGPCDRERVRRAMAEAKVLIVPSTWYEGFPLVIVEAFAAGLPILASRLGAMAEFIADGQTGRLFAPGDAAGLAGAVEWAFSHSDEMRRMRALARSEYDQKYTAKANYTRLMLIYEAALGRLMEAVHSIPRLEAIG